MRLNPLRELRKVFKTTFAFKLLFFSFFFVFCDSVNIFDQGNIFLQSQARQIVFMNGNRLFATDATCWKTISKNYAKQTRRSVT